MSNKLSEISKVFVGEVPEPTAKELCLAIRAKHGPPAPVQRTVIQARRAPKDWRADKTAKALGKVTNA